MLIDKGNGIIGATAKMSTTLPVRRIKAAAPGCILRGGRFPRLRRLSIALTSRKAAEVWKAVAECKFFSSQFLVVAFRVLSSWSSAARMRSMLDDKQTDWDATRNRAALLVSKMPSVSIFKPHALPRRRSANGREWKGPAESF